MNLFLPFMNSVSKGKAKAGEKKEKHIPKEKVKEFQRFFFFPLCFLVCCCGSAEFSPEYERVEKFHRAIDGRASTVKSIISIFTVIFDESTDLFKFRITSYIIVFAAVFLLRRRSIRRLASFFLII